MRGRPWTEADMKRAVGLYRSGMGIGEIAELMGRRRSFISDILHENGGRRYAKWTPEDDDRLAWMVAEGANLAQVARALMRSVSSVKARMIRTECGVRQQKSFYSANRLAADEFSYGVYPNHVRDWMRRGWLKSRNNKIMREQFIAFLEKPDYWYAWTPDLLKDTDLRSWAEEEREAAGWRWLSVKEAATLLCIGVAGVQARCRTGALSSARRYPNRTWWIRSDDEGLRT